MSIGRFVSLAGLLFLTVAGCTLGPSEITITEETELMQEGPFQFRYPKDWKITAEADNTNLDAETAVYIFRHPKNKACQIRIEVATFPSTAKASSSVNKTVTAKTRQFKKTYEKAGYKNFSFRSHETDFAGASAVRLAASGIKGKISKETSAVVLPHKDELYVVWFEWISPWGPEAKSRLEKTTKTFRFIN